ncbi:MAG: hypothetical protein K6E83_10445 [Clostridium sp.]|nr:hypothetical protein [Clostridium sp.]
MRPADRLQVSTSFAEAIIAKYRAPEGQDLPSVRFAYLKTAALAAETMDRLAAQLITLNRIRVNIHNYHWIRNYAVSLENSCRVLFSELSFHARTAPGAVSASSLRELERVFREMEESTVRSGAAGSGESSGTAFVTVPQEEERILRILTAASRGNGMRERYMSLLYRRLKESERSERPDASSREILQGAVTELFQIGRLQPVMNSWASEEARQFFWRVQRAPEQERNMILRAGGYSTILSLERELKVMDRAAFRRFSAALAEQLMNLPEFSAVGTGGDVPAVSLVEQMPEEEWNRFTEELAQAGFVFGSDSLHSPDESPYWASEQARQLFWRIQRAPEQERRFFLQAGGFAGMETLETLLRTMDEVTFRSFSAQLLGRLTRFSEEKSEVNASSPELVFIKDTQRFLRGEQVSSNLTVTEEKRIFAETLSGRREGAEILFRMLRDYTERTEILRENRTAGEALSETILNLTMAEWEQFREELNIPEIRHILPHIPGIVSGENGEAPSAEPAGEPEPGSPEQALLIQGMRMSREKREMIRTLYDLSLIPDSSFRVMDRVLRENTILREYSIRENSRQYFRSLSARERENWADFVRELLKEGEPGGVSPDQVFLRMYSGNAAAAGVPGIADILADTERSGREAAGSVLEHLREARIEIARTDTAELRTARTDTAELRTARTEVLQGRYIREPSEAALESAEAAAESAEAAMESAEAAREIAKTAMESAEAARETAEAAVSAADILRYQDIPELSSADMEVPSGQAAAAQQGAPAVPASEVRETRTEYHDIEFETVTHRTEERITRETGRDLKELADRLERQERELGRIRDLQERMAGRNLKGEVLKKLEEQAKMERLRGGR